MTSNQKLAKRLSTISRSIERVHDDIRKKSETRSDATNTLLKQLTDSRVYLSMAINRIEQNMF